MSFIFFFFIKRLNITVMSNKVSYVTKEGLKELKKLMLRSFSQNPLQFISDARIRLSCVSVLDSDEIEEVYFDVKTSALLHKANAEKIMADEYTPKTFEQKIVLDNAICEYNNFITMIEGLEKSNARNSK